MARKLTDEQLWAMLDRAQASLRTTPPPRSYDADRARRISASHLLRQLRLAENDPDCHPIRLLRLRQRMSVRRLAAKAGVSPNAVWRAERRLRTSRNSTYGKLAKALGARPADLRE